MITSLAGRSGKQPPIAGDDLAAHGVPDEHGALEAERADQVVQIEREVSEAVVRRGLAVAVAAQIERQDVEAVDQPARQVVEGVRVVAQAVHDDERGQPGIAPIAEVDAQRPAAKEALAELRHRGAHASPADQQVPGPRAFPAAGFVRA